MTEHLFRDALEAMPESFALHRIIRDEAGQFSDLEVVAQNPAAARMSGVPSEGLVGKRVLTVFPSHRDSEIWKTYRRVAETGEPSRVETPYQGEGIEGWFETTTARVGTDHLAIFGRDITARRREAEALIFSEQKFAGIVSIAPDALITVDEQQRITVFNDGAEAIFGYRRSEVLGTPIDGLIPERFHASHRVQARAFTDDPIPARKMGSRVQVVGRRKGGEEFPAEASISHFKIGQRSISSVALRDITDHLQADSKKRLLERVSAALAASIDYEKTLATVLEVCIPDLADFCSVYVVEGSTSRRLSAHVDPLKVEVTRQTFEEQDPAAHKGTLVSQTLRQARTFHEVFTPQVLEDRLKKIDFPSTALQLETRSLVCTPLIGAGGKVIGVLTLGYGESGRTHSPATIALAEEIARRAALAIDNARLYDSVLRADRRKEEFLATLGHELRNPLAPLHASAQVLILAGSKDPAVRRAAEVIDRQVGHLARLIDDLLDASRVASGKLELRIAPLDVAAAVRSAIETSTPWLSAKSHSLSVELPERPLWVTGDMVRLSQVLSNLLTNAAKYTQPGGRIAVVVERSGDEAVLRVRDNGAGIPRPMLARIFEMFTQLGAASESQGGLGIGLSLARSLVALHHGTIEAHSPGPGMGSEFIVRLPLADPSTVPEPALAAASPAPTPATERLRFLVVDDNRDSAEALAELLAALGNEVTTVFDGASALEKAAAAAPDVVLLDLGMPGMSGYEVAQKLRALPALAKTVLVAQTGWGQAEDRRRTREAGFDHHLTKPLSIEALERLVEGIKRERSGGH